MWLRRGKITSIFSRLGVGPDPRSHRTAGTHVLPPRTITRQLVFSSTGFRVFGAITGWQQHATGVRLPGDLRDPHDIVRLSKRDLKAVRLVASCA
jgi:hypothetical protein